MENLKNSYSITIIFSNTGKLLLTNSKKHLDDSVNCYTGLLCNRNSKTVRGSIVDFIKDNLNIAINETEIRQLCNVNYKGNNYIIMFYRSVYEFKTIFIPGINFHWVKPSELNDKTFNIPDFKALITIAANKVMKKSNIKYFYLDYE